jgi:hypothetical protein
MKAEHLTLEEVKAYGERALTPRDALEISDHLVGCSKCREMLQRAERSRAVDQAQAHVTYEELAAYIDNQLNPLARREVSEKLERSPQARRELVDLLEFKKQMAAEESGINFQKWILPIAAGIMIAAIFGWWNSSYRPSGIAGNLSPQLRETMNELTEGRFVLPSHVANLRGTREQLAGASTRRSSSLRLISPIASAVATQTPRFRWNGIENASTYRVTIVPRDRDEPIESIEVPGDQTSCVSKPLTPGETYRWEVQALRDGDPVAQAPAPPEPEAMFCVLDRQQQDEVAREREKFGHSHLALGLIYARSGMIDEAYGEFHELEKEDVDLAQKLRVALENSQKQ